MNYLTWFIDLRIPSLPPSPPKKEYNYLETHHLWVVDMGSKYSGQLSPEQRKKHTVCGYAEDDRIYKHLFTITEKWTTVSRLFPCFHRCNRSDSWNFFFFFLFNVPSACAPRRDSCNTTSPFYSGPAVFLASQNFSELPGMSGSFPPRCGLQIAPREGVDFGSAVRTLHWAGWMLKK